MPRAAVFPTVPVSVLLLAALILPVFAGENPRTQTEAAKTPEPGFMLTLETVEAPGIDIKPYFTAVADRKSTRLNSSHVAISYAVFCLKKKKKTRTKQI